MKWAPGDCKTADIVRIKTGALYHYGIFVSEDEVIQFGYPPLPEYADKNSPPVVCSVDIDTFCSGRIVERAEFDRAERRKKFPPEKIIAAARARIGEGGYNIIHNNCEHFVNECVFGIKKCEQEEEVRRKWQNRVTLDVYCAKIPDRIDGEIKSPARQKYIEETKSETLKAERRFVWIILQYALRRSAGLDAETVEFVRLDNGQWVIKNGSVYFSLSHKSGYAAAAVSDRPVGIDIETYGALDRGYSPDEFKKLVLHRSERADTEKDLIALFTKKESIFKQRGEEVFVPNRIKIRSYKTKTFSVKELPEVVISVCGEPENLRCYVYGNGSAVPKKTGEI